MPPAGALYASHVTSGNLATLSNTSLFFSRVLSLFCFRARSRPASRGYRQIGRWTSRRRDVVPANVVHNIPPLIYGCFPFEQFRLNKKRTTGPGGERTRGAQDWRDEEDSKSRRRAWLRTEKFRESFKALLKCYRTATCKLRILDELRSFYIRDLLQRRASRNSVR